MMEWLIQDFQLSMCIKFFSIDMRSGEESGGGGQEFKRIGWELRWTCVTGHMVGIQAG